MNLKEIDNNGILLSELKYGYKDLSLVSLKLAMQSFFESAKSIKDIDYIPENRDTIFDHTYIYYYSETILHFHHFFELCLKEYLRKINELLVLNIQNEHDILYHLLKENKISEDRLSKINTIEFGFTLDRFCKIFRNNHNDANIEAIVNNSEVLKKLNKLRNRIWHRGVFLLDYFSFDDFICRYLLPLVENILVLLDYKIIENKWKYKNLDCGIDPLIEIMNEYKNNQANKYKIFMLKIFGSAAYNIKYDETTRFLKMMTMKYKKISENTAITQNNTYRDTRKCPVCGTNSLVEDEDYETFESDDEQSIETIRISCTAECFHCNLLINNEKLDPVDFGYSVKFWK